jgi:hypothetical protein
VGKRASIAELKNLSKQKLARSTPAFELSLSLSERANCPRRMILLAARWAESAVSTNKGV